MCRAAVDFASATALSDENPSNAPLPTIIPQHVLAAFVVISLRSVISSKVSGFTNQALAIYAQPFNLPGRRNRSKQLYKGMPFIYIQIYLLTTTNKVSIA